MFRNPKEKFFSEIVDEWDAIAPIRIQQILSGKDTTFDFILSPGIMTFAEPGGAQALDAGCGVGVLTSRLSGLFENVLGVDPSEQSIKLAKRHFENDRVTFLKSTLEDFAKKSKKRFDFVSANMVLMDVSDIDPFLAACERLLKPGGRLAFSITHPAFWPNYYGYGGEPWYDYNKELIIESPFRISADQDCRLISTHIHRPLSRYVASISESGLFLERLLEPVPNATVAAKYPSRWEKPRYVLAQCRKVRRLGSH